MPPSFAACAAISGVSVLFAGAAAFTIVSGVAGAAEGVFLGREAQRRLQSAIEGGCFDAMLLQQPLVAGDLRFVSGSFRIVSDLAHIEAMTRDVAFLATAVPSREMGDLSALLSEASERVAIMVDRAVGRAV